MKKTLRSYRISPEVDLLLKAEAVNQSRPGSRVSEADLIEGAVLKVYGSAVEAVKRMDQAGGKIAKPKGEKALRERVGAEVAVLRESASGHFHSGVLPKAGCEGCAQLERER